MYSNPKLPEGINTSKEHPLKEFSILLVGALLLIVAATLVLGISGSWLAAKIPFSAELAITRLYKAPDLSTLPEQQQKLVTYLQLLANRIAKTQKLPDKMKIRIHYLSDDTLNAFATLGGNVIVYRGLLEKLHSENELSMLLAHEIAHVKFRHPIKSLGRGVTAGIAMAAITGSTDSKILGETGLLTTLHFSRKMEQQCDEEAMKTLVSLYGQIAGGADLFRRFQQMRTRKKQSESMAMFNSHPLDQARIDNFGRMAQLNHWKTKGDVTPLPAFFSTTH